MKGVATVLLHQVIADAKAEGYTAVIGFPFIRDERYEWDNNGPIRLYEKTGFVKAGEHEGHIVMRKALNG
jgi:GNAT superfamily N-acetyltransferase